MMSGTVVVVVVVWTYTMHYCNWLMAGLKP